MTLAPGPTSPRIYIPSPVTKAFCILAGLILLGVGLGPVLLLTPAAGFTNASLPQAPLFAWILVGCDALILPTIAFRFLRRALRARVIWSQHAIELFGRRGHQVLQIKDIVGRKSVREERGWSVELMSKDRDAKRFVLPMEWVLPFDADFKNWIRAIPEADAKSLV